jgi:hypothetical protein
MAVQKSSNKSHKHTKKSSKNVGWLATYWGKLRAQHWYIRWTGYVIGFLLLFFFLNWLLESAMPQVKNPNYGVSFSIKYAEELGNDWQANYTALLDDMHVKKLRLMSYWDLVEPQQGQYDFKDLDWQVDQANARGAKISLAIGFRQPRYPECHEPQWATSMPVNETAWDNALYDYLTTTVNRYKNNPAIESYQLENEAENNWFGSCRGSAAPRERLQHEFDLVKGLDKNHPVFMSLSDEHGFPIGQPKPDGYGFSIYRVVYSTNTKIHFYTTYPITDWYHRLRVLIIDHTQHRPVFVHELQMEPWGSKATVDLSVEEQDKSMSVSQIHKSFTFGRKTGIKLQYLWGGEWWYWRKTHFNDPGPWNAVKQELQKAQTNST